MKMWIYTLLLLQTICGCSKKDLAVFDLRNELREIDEIRFSFSSAFSGYCWITLKHNEYGPDPYTLSCTVNYEQSTDYRKEEVTTRRISHNDFKKFEEIFWDFDLVRDSLDERFTHGTDGCFWTISAQKGKFLISHTRFCPSTSKDADFIKTAEQFLDFAGIQLPEGYPEDRGIVQQAAGGDRPR